MKKLTLIFLGAVTLTLTGCNNSKNAIADVVQQRLAARLSAVDRETVTNTIAPDSDDVFRATQHVEVINDVTEIKTTTFWSNQKYFNSLESIDVTKCPKDFRDAWLDYVAAWERNINYNLHTAAEDAAAAGQVDVSANASIGSTTGVGGSFNGQQGGKELENRLLQRDNNEKWLVCKQIATDYGVFVPPDPK
jgi:hypothetical protein